MTYQSSVFASIAFAAGALATVPGSTLDDCLAFADKFANTCDSTSTPLADLSAHQGAPMSCTGNKVRCPNTDAVADYTDSEPCSWYRKLCVTCREENGDVIIQVQGNGLPNHCINSTVNFAVAMEQEWEVVFQPDVSNQMNYSASDVDSKAKTTELMCDIQRTASSNMLAASKYQYLSSGRAGLQTASGIALSGMYIFNSLASGNTDALDNEIRSMDVCLCHPTGFGQIHYHYWSPCIKEGRGMASTTTAPNLCKNNNRCMNEPDVFVQNRALSGQSTAYDPSIEEYGGVLGIARDGHIMIGPYQADGSEWACDDHDICNGAFVDGQYVYVATSTFPYVVGCWGPGPTQSYEATCSSSSCAVTNENTDTTDETVPIDETEDLASTLKFVSGFQVAAIILLSILI